MKLNNQTPFVFGLLSGHNLPGGVASLTVVVKGSFIITPEGLTPAGQQAPMRGEVWADPDQPYGEILYDADLAPTKPTAEVLVVGQVHTPGEEPVPMCNAGITVGRWSKEIMAIGERVWVPKLLGAKPGEPQLFSEMPLRWSLAAEGKYNPVGRASSDLMMPCIEVPHKPKATRSTRVPPAGLGPLNRRWPIRANLQGTYGKRWAATRWPGPADDFDPHFYLSAPPDQRLSGYLQGDEELALLHLLKGTAKWEGSLPGIRVRCVLERLPAPESPTDTTGVPKTGESEDEAPPAGQPEDLPLNLDTLIVDTEAQRLELLWRGIARVYSTYLEDIGGVTLVAENLQREPASATQIAAATMKTAPPQAPMTPGPYGKGGELQHLLKREPLLAGDDAVAALAMDAEVKQAVQEAAALEAQLADADWLDPVITLPGPDRAAAAGPALAGIATVLKRAKEEQLADVEAPATTALMQEIEAFSGEGRFEQYQPLTTTSARAARPAKLPSSREEVEKALAVGIELSGRDLRGLDLTGLSFAGVDLSGAILQGCRLSEVDLSEANLRGAVLAGADLTAAMLDHATLNDADVFGATLAQATLREASLAWARFDHAHLNGADLTGATGDHVGMHRADLTGATLVDATLPSIDLSRALLRNAVLRGATLDGAWLDGADATAVDLSNAHATNLRAGRGAVLAQAKLDGIVATGSAFLEVDLTEASMVQAYLAGADFTQSTLEGAKLGSADARGARFVMVAASNLQAQQTNCYGATFERADLTGAAFGGACLFETGFWGATVEGADFAMADLGSTLLEGNLG